MDKWDKGKQDKDDNWDLLDDKEEAVAVALGLMALTLLAMVLEVLI